MSGAGSDLTRILAKLREKRENAPEPQPLTPEEQEQIRVGTERLRKTLLGVRRYIHLRSPPSPSPFITLPAVTVEPVELDPRKIAAAFGAAGSRPSRPTGRPLIPLELAKVEFVGKRLTERRKIKQRTGGSVPSELTYEAIAKDAGWLGTNGRPNRERVKQIEALIDLDWPLRKSHPDFPAEQGFVRLPTPHQAARLLHSS